MAEEEATNSQDMVELTMTDHPTFVRSSGEFVLKRCDDPACQCGKVHCPFGGPNHFKPTLPARVRDHLNLFHFMHGVHYEDMLIVKCFLDCNTTLPSGHYHCPYCPKLIGKRLGFSNHLQMHMEKMGKDVNLIQSPDFKQPEKIIFDGLEILICSNLCDEALGKHYHCPLCSQKNFSELGPMMSHLWRCREETRHGGQPQVKKKPMVKKDQKSVTASLTHPSIVKSQSDLAIQRGNDDKKYRCSLCSDDKYNPGNEHQLAEHLNTVHWKGRIEVKGMYVLPCNNTCEQEKGSGRLCTHYHCPSCSDTWRGSDILRSHVRLCKGKTGTLSTTLDPKTSRDLPKEAATETEAHVALSRSSDGADEVEALGQLGHVTAPPISRRDKAMAAIMELAESSDEMEAFDKVTAVVSKRIISSLQQSANVEDILDDVARDTGITWSWSPGTMEPVYVMSGDLIALVKAKRELKQLKEVYEQQRQQIAQAQLEELERTEANEEDLEEGCGHDPEEVPAWSGSRILPNPDEEIPGQVIGSEQLESDTPGQTSILDLGSGTITIEPLQQQQHFQTPRKQDMSVPPLQSAPHQYGVGNEDQPAENAQVHVEPKPFESVSEAILSVDEMLRKSEEPVPEEGYTPMGFSADRMDAGRNMEGSFADTLIQAASAELVMTRPDGLSVQDEMLLRTGTSLKTSMEQIGQAPIFDESKPLVSNLYVAAEDGDVDSGDKTVPEEEASAVVVVVEEKPAPKKRGRKRKGSVPTPVPVVINSPSRYATRGVKVDFSFLHSGRRKDEVKVESSDSEAEEVAPTPKRRGRGRPPKQTPTNVETEVDVSVKTEKRGRGRPPSRGRGRPPGYRVTKKEESEEEEEREEEEVESDDEEVNDYDSDKDPEFKVKSEKYGEEEEVEEEEEELQGDEKVERKQRRLTATAFNIASMPVVKFTGKRGSDVEIGGQKPKRKYTRRLESFRGKLPIKRRGRRRRPGEPITQPFESLVCLDCAYIAETFQSLTDHYIVEHGVRPARCDMCEKSFGRYQNLIHHLVMKHGPFDMSDGKVYQFPEEKNKNTCSKCGFISETFDGLTDHLILSHQVLDTLRCDVCEVVFQKSREKSFHIHKIHGPEARMEFPCDICGFILETRRGLNWHRSYYHSISTKNNKNQLYCAKCDFEAKDSQELKLHKKTHLEERKFCDICQKTFSKSTDLKTHIQAVHLKSKSVPCTICCKEFSHYRYLAAHMEWHSNERKHLCNICGRCFKKAAILREHIETHKVMSERNYKFRCTYCEKRYWAQDKLLDHMNKHTGEKPHICDVCGKGFSFKSMLNKHKIYLHTSERPFKCSCCEKSFKFKQILKNHMVIHTGKSRFMCDGCKRPFSCSATLKTHRPKCRGENSYPPKRKPTPKLPTQHIMPLAVKQETIEVAVTQQQQTFPQLVDTIVVEMSDGQRSIVDLNSLEAAAQMADADNAAATGIYLCSVCNAMFDSVNSAEEHIAIEHRETDPGDECQDPTGNEIEVDAETAAKMQLHFQEVMEPSEADANISSIISELQQKVKAKMEPVSILLPSQ
ncbi:uncharacterized protein LOC121390525 isoform X2 [Gigantopelta aegis]|uniref:uncharacterized protein LOC121390525 isoform X2 n=1 Tax=Gigantopelta aegis TaxID=1735272 RepID=UPI001B889282|nr:uncharacterized protein LOC121390525 isoform X2 [Gigantopelta aegis]